MLDIIGFHDLPLFFLPICQFLFQDTPPRLFWAFSFFDFNKTIFLILFLLYLVQISFKRVISLQPRNIWEFSDILYKSGGIISYVLHDSTLISVVYRTEID